MVTWLITTVSLCCAVGLVLVVLGLRGRRLDQNPICRRCGFDLQGRFPWSQPTRPTCPDCGEPLLTFKSVRPGARALRTRLLTSGLMLCFPGLILLLAGAADTIAGGATANIKTTTMLVGQVSGNTKGSASLRVLTGRVATGGTDAADLQPAIERALALQSNRDVELDPQWIELLEAARRRGLLSPEQLQRYFEGAIDWRLFTLPTGTHQPVPFAVQAFVDRLGLPPTDAPLFISIECVASSLDGKPLRFGGTLDQYSTPPRTGPLRPGALVEVVDAAGHNAEFGPGKKLEFSWSVEVRRGAAGGPVVASWTQRVKAKADVEVGSGQAPARVSDADELSERTKLAGALAPDAIVLERDASGACWASFSIRPSALRHDVVAILRITTRDGQVYDGLTPVTITPNDPRRALLTAADPSASPWKVRVQLNGMPGAGKAAVELVPHPSVRTLALSRSLWVGEPIRIEGVELRSATPPAAPTPNP